jgi:hypothetical protein
MEGVVEMKDFETPFANLLEHPMEGRWHEIPQDEIELNRVRRKADDLLAEMNAKHCVVLSQGRIATRSNGKWVVQSKSDFTFRYCNQHVMRPHADRSVTLAQWWLHHPNRRQCESFNLLYDEDANDR